MILDVWVQSKFNLINWRKALCACGRTDVHILLLRSFYDFNSQLLLHKKKFIVLQPCTKINFTSVFYGATEKIPYFSRNGKDKVLFIFANWMLQISEKIWENFHSERIGWKQPYSCKVDFISLHPDNGFKTVSERFFNFPWRAKIMFFARKASSIWWTFSSLDVHFFPLPTEPLKFRVAVAGLGSWHRKD